MKQKNLFETSRNMNMKKYNIRYIAMYKIAYILGTMQQISGKGIRSFLTNISSTGSWLTELELETCTSTITLRLQICKQYLL